MINLAVKTNSGKFCTAVTDCEMLSITHFLILIFRCNSSVTFDSPFSQCISVDRMCDGFQDCWDGSDELNSSCIGMPDLTITCL